MKKISSDWGFNDVVLYAKGWYERKDLFKDLGHIFQEIYWWEPQKHDIVDMMWRILDKVCEHFEPEEKAYFLTFAYVENQVAHYMDLYNCDRDTAVCYFVIGVLQGLTLDQIEVKKPVYGKKKYFRYGGGLIVTHDMHRKVQTMTYKQMNKMAEKAFG